MIKSLSSFLSALILLLLAAPVQAQVDSEVAAGVRVYAAPEIDQMVERHKKINLETGVMAGYRIQIYANPDYNSARKKKTEFDLEFEDYRSVIVLEEPDFKVFVGQYLDRFDAYHDLQQLIPEYPGAFLVKDLIDVGDL